jgi:hypothetical protein
MGEMAMEKVMAGRERTEMGCWDEVVVMKLETLRHETGARCSVLVLPPQVAPS